MDAAWTHDSQDSAPYAEALRAHAQRPWLRGTVPGHGDDPQRFVLLAAHGGPGLLHADVPPLMDGIDVGVYPTPLDRSLRLAAEAWGARRTWFLTNGASQGNRIAILAMGGPSRGMVVQRSVHSSVVDGLVLSGAPASFVEPSIDVARGIAHGVTPADLDRGLTATPAAAVAYVITPSYFGAVADVAGLAAVAHAHGVPLVVDEAWGAHFGFHPDLPANALSQGADVVVSSTHKLGGSLTQSAMLHLGEGRLADEFERNLDRAYRLTQSTSTSGILMASLDLARQELATGKDRITESVEAADQAREAIVAGGRYALVSDTFGQFADIVAADPLRISIDTAVGGVSGHDARWLLMTEHEVLVEASTEAAIVVVVGAGARPDLDRLVRALHALPESAVSPLQAGSVPLPGPGPVELTARQAFFAPSELVPAAAAIGRVSADALAAYPPGVPNVLPGEVVTPPVVSFLRWTAGQPTGYVRGAADPAVDSIRVVTDPDQARQQL